MLTINSLPISSFFFFFNDTAPTEIYTLSLHDALPISPKGNQTSQQSHGDRQRQNHRQQDQPLLGSSAKHALADQPRQNRKSTRLNSSHGYISYAVFCLKKKKKIGSKKSLSYYTHAYNL